MNYTNKNLAWIFGIGVIIASLVSLKFAKRAQRYERVLRANGIFAKASEVNLVRSVFDKINGATDAVRAQLFADEVNRQIELFDYYVTFVKPFNIGTINVNGVMISNVALDNFARNLMRLAEKVSGTTFATPEMLLVNRDVLNNAARASVQENLDMGLALNATPDIRAAGLQPDAQQFELIKNSLGV